MLVLNTYIGTGTTRLDSMDSISILPPYRYLGASWYEGTATRCQNIDFIDNYEPEYVLISPETTSIKWL